MEDDDDATLLPSLAIVGGKVGIHDAFVRIIGVDFFVDLLIGFKDGMYMRTEGESFTDFLIGLADQVILMLGKELFHRCIHQCDLPVLVDEHDTTHHIRDDARKLLFILLYLLHLALQTCSKRIDGLGEVADFTFCLRAHPAAVVLPSQAGSDIHDVVDRSCNAPCKHGGRNGGYQEHQAEGNRQAEP